MEGVDWVILNPKPSLMKNKFKNKSPSKLNVGEAYVGQSVGQVWDKYDTHFHVVLTFTISFLDISRCHVGCSLT